MFSLKETEHGKFVYRCQACGWQCEIETLDRIMAVNQAIACSQFHKCTEPELPEIAKEEKQRIHESVRTFARAIGCEITIDGGKEFARFVMTALAEAAFEGGDVYEGVARKLLALRARKEK